MKQAYLTAVIDDEAPIRRMLRVAIEGEGAKVVEAETGGEGLIVVAQRQPDIVLLDLGLPDMDGLETLDRLREWSDVPVIVLTVRDDPEEKVAALDSGADDFITKPFHMGELLARMRVALKHRAGGDRQPVVEVGALRVDFLERRVFVDEQLLELTPIEYKIVQSLARHPGRIVTKTALLEAVWGKSASATEDHLRVHLAAVRRKLRDRGQETLIKTETGVGYRLSQVSPGVG